MKKIVKKNKNNLGRPVSIKKHENILKAAQFLFHKNGFEGVTMDEIAKRANVVKATLYNQFQDKENLFIEMMKNSISGLESENNVDEMMKNRKIQEILIDVSQKLITFLESNEVKNAHRLMIMQAEKHKKLAQLFMQNGPYRIKKLIAEILEKSQKRGEIKVDNFEEKASYFIMMLVNMNCFEMLMNLGKKRDKKQIEKDVKNATIFFLKSLN